MLKVLIATGGTGGHLFPSEKLAMQMKECEVFFAGHHLKKSPFFSRKIPFQEIQSASSKLKIFSLLKGIWQSIRLILKFSPDVVVGFGSFHSFPVLMAALLLRKKIVLYEPNCSLGKVNRLFAPFAKKVALQFPIPHKKAVYVHLVKHPPVSAKRKNEKKTILVFGGSQGAAFINETFCKAAKLLTFPFEVIHLTGKEAPEIHYSVPALIKPFEADMASLYPKVDLAVCRCGAGTSAELIRYRIPAVVIPYPFAHDHQRENGKFLGQGVRILDQTQATPESLAYEIEQLNAHLEDHEKALASIELPETVELAAVVRAVGRGV